MLQFSGAGYALAASTTGAQAEPCTLPSQPFSASSQSLSNQSNSLVFRDRTWISIDRIDFNMASRWMAQGNRTDDYGTVATPVIHCTFLSADKMERLSQVATAIEGADDCKQGKAVCVLPAGVSDGSRYRYSQSISEDEAISIARDIQLIDNRAILQHDGKYYLLQLFTTDEKIQPQAIVEFLDPHLSKDGNNNYADKIIHLGKGQSVTIPIIVRTFATYGKPANITLVAGVSAQDSGILLKIEPSPTFIVPERSTANANITITADNASAQEGLYRFSMMGKEGWVHTCGEYTDYNCPLIQIGNSTWEINTSSGGLGVGGKAPPDWLDIRTETDKDVYHKGETIMIKSYIENNGNDIATLQSIRLIIDIGTPRVYSNPSLSTTATDTIYAIDAYPNNSTIIIQPHSRALLVRPFYWNQETLTSEDPDHVLVQAGNYSISTSFAFSYRGNGFVANHDKDIQVTNTTFHSDSIVKDNETDAGTGMQFPFIIGAGAAIAGIVAFMTLRKRG